MTTELQKTGRLISAASRLPMSTDGYPLMPGDSVGHPEQVTRQPLTVVAGCDGAAGPDDWVVEVPSGLGADGFVDRSFEVHASECYRWPTT